MSGLLWALAAALASVGSKEASAETTASSKPLKRDISFQAALVVIVLIMTEESIVGSTETAAT